MSREVLTPTHDDHGPGRLTILMVASGGAVLALMGIRAANAIIAPALLGLVIVVTVFPLADWSRRRGAPVWLAMLVTMLLSYGITFVLFFGTIVALATFVRLLPDYADEFSSLQGSVTTWLSGVGVTTADLEGALEGLSPSQVAGAVRSAAGSVGSVLGALLLLVTVTFFLVLDAAGFPARMALIRHTRPELADAFSEFAHGTRIYLFVATVFGGIVALIDVGILYVLDIPNPWVWGFLAFLTGYIPNVGFVVGLLPVSVLALLQGGVGDMLIVIAAYSAVNFVLQSLVQPKFVGDSVGLATTVTFLSLAFWTFVIGPIGAILAVPLTLLAKALLVSLDPSKAWANALISSTPNVEDAESREPESQVHAVPGSAEPGSGAPSATDRHGTNRHGTIGG